MKSTLDRFYNKSFLAPLADRYSTKQLRFLLLSSPVTIIVNNYKSNLSDLDSFRTSVKENNGFVYHPNKNIKTRAFKELSTGLTSNMLGGLVVFIFFGSLPQALKFLNNSKSWNSNSLSYFSVLLDGHLASSITTYSRFENFNIFHLLNFSVLNFNKLLIQASIKPFIYSIYNISIILNAYIKSINKGFQGL